MWPHVYADVTEEMQCFQREIFGPVVTVVKADDFENALHLANASPFGLSSACYTNDRLEAYRFKTGIKAGMTGINNSTTGLRHTYHLVVLRIVEMELGVRNMGDRSLLILACSE